MCGPLTKGYFRLCRPNTSEGAMEQKNFIAPRCRLQQGVITLMPFSTGFLWPTYTYMDYIYGPFGIEKLFHELFSITFIFTF